MWMWSRGGGFCGYGRRRESRYRWRMRMVHVRIHICTGRCSCGDMCRRESYSMSRCMCGRGCRYGCGYERTNGRAITKTTHLPPSRLSLHPTPTSTYRHRPRLGQSGPRARPSSSRILMRQWRVVMRVTCNINHRATIQSQWPSHTIS